MSKSEILRCAQNDKKSEILRCAQNDKRGRFEMENIILKTILILGGVLITLIGIGVALIQYMKEKWGWEDKKAEILSLGVGFVLAALVVLSYLEQMAWRVNISQGVGIFLFLVVGTIGPSGGYKTLRALLGGKLNG